MQAAHALPSNNRSMALLKIRQLAMPLTRSSRGTDAVTYESHRWELACCLQFLHAHVRYYAAMDSC